MSKFDRVLSDDELLEIATSKGSLIHKNEDGIFIYGTDRFPISRAFLLGMLRAVDASVQIRLAEQEPVAWRVWLEDLQCWSYSCDYHGCGEPLYAHPCVSPASDKTACVSEIAESETQTNSQGLLDSSNQEKIQIISLLKSLRLDFGAVGTRDVDVAAQNNRIDAAIKAIESHARRCT